MRVSMLLILLLVALPGALASAGDDRIAKLEKIDALDPGTKTVAVRYTPGMFARLVKRCPDLRELDVEEHSDFPPADVRALKDAKHLEKLVIGGDLGIDEDVFEALGELEQLRHIEFGLG